MEYFKWRKDYEVIFSHKFPLYCLVCQFLHTNNTRKIMDYKQWVLDKKECKDPYKEINFGND